MRRTVVCRSLSCSGGGWWGSWVPDRCPYCSGKLTELAPVRVLKLVTA